ncbi:MAG: transposase [Clostridiales bacterium]|nr:transposase [Clostridiales bacterium]MCD8214691.1 transposase [Clostridiales bacterium]
MAAIKSNVPVCEKYLLDFKEAVSYFNIGEKKLRSILEDNMNSNLSIQNGVKWLIKRKRFEEYLDKTSSI